MNATTGIRQPVEPTKGHRVRCACGYEISARTEAAAMDAHRGHVSHCPVSSALKLMTHQ